MLTMIESRKWLRPDFGPSSTRPSPCLMPVTRKLEPLPLYLLSTSQRNSLSTNDQALAIKSTVSKPEYPQALFWWPSIHSDSCASWSISSSPSSLSYCIINLHMLIWLIIVRLKSNWLPQVLNVMIKVLLAIFCDDRSILSMFIWVCRWLYLRDRYRACSSVAAKTPSIASAVYHVKTLYSSPIHNHSMHDCLLCLV